MDSVCSGEASFNSLSFACFWLHLYCSIVVFGVVFILVIVHFLLIFSVSILSIVKELGRCMEGSVSGSKSGHLVSKILAVLSCHLPAPELGTDSSWCLWKFMVRNV